MEFSLNEEQTAIAELASQVLSDNSTHEQLRAVERSDGPRFDRALWAQAAERVSWPAQPRFMPWPERVNWMEPLFVISTSALLQVQPVRKKTV